MNIPIRIIQQKVLSRQKRFSILKGLRTILHNFKTLFTHKIVEDSSGWWVVTEDAKTIDDVSLMWANGKLDFMLTPPDAGIAALEITQEVKE